MADKKIYRELELEYDRLKNSSEREYRERMDRIYEQHPKLQELSSMINVAGARAAVAIAKGDEQQRAENIEKLEELKNLKRNYMAVHGITDYDLTRHYNCEQCKDTGYIDGGQMCQCRKKRLAERAYDRSTISRVLKVENFDSFDINRFSEEIPQGENICPKENMSQLRFIAEDFVRNIDVDGQKSLLLYGPPGQGKTFLANCIARELIERDKSVIYQTAYDFVHTLERTSFGGDVSEDDKLRAELIRNCDLLIIDDLGTEMPNTFTVSELFNVINLRMLGGKKMIISTNLTPSELQTIYSDRVFSRMLAGFMLLRFFGKDQRY